MIRSATITTRHWGKFKDRDVMLFRITNETGAYVELTNYGATLVSVVVPDKYDTFDNVILGYPDLQGYIRDSCYIGSTIGRFANRINNARFVLDGVTYDLEKNDGRNTNHGGFSGFHAKVFDYITDDNELTFSLTSYDGEGGYPGNLKLQVRYHWSDNNELSIRYYAETDKKTIANFTNHAYFNLYPGGQDILDHDLLIDSEKILETTREHIPTGKIIAAGDRKFNGNKVYEKMTISDGMMTGLNTYYFFNKKDAACQLGNRSSGRVLELSTSYPGVQLYTGDFLGSTTLNNRSSFHKPFDGLCLECQYCPDSPNHENFPSTILEPGKVYNEYIVYKFKVNEN